MLRVIQSLLYSILSEVFNIYLSFCSTMSDNGQRKKDPTPTIPGSYDFKDIFPRIKEPPIYDTQGNPLRDDPFTRAFLNLGKVLREQERDAEAGKCINVLSYPFLREKEEEGIFLMGGKEIAIYKQAFTFSGGPLDPRWKGYLHGYARELRKFVSEESGMEFTPVNRYFGDVFLHYDFLEDAVNMPMACAMNLDGLFCGFLLPLQDSLERVVYQVVEANKMEVLSAGFLYVNLKKEIELKQIKSSA